MENYLLDTNVLVSGVLWGGNESRLIELAKKGCIKVLTSRYILKEFERVLEHLGKEKVKVGSLVELIHNLSEVVDVGEKEISVCLNDVRDKKDAPILAACIKTGSILVTGDKILAEDAGRFIKVMSPKETLERIKLK